LPHAWQLVDATGGVSITEQGNQPDHLEEVK
jgi:hypothetical protein